MKRVSVLDRTKEPGALDDPLYLDVCASLYKRQNAPVVLGGRYGLGSKDFTPADVMAVMENMQSTQPRTRFTVSINDDVTHTSLPLYTTAFDPTPTGTTACKFWGLGSDGTVSANMSAIKIIGDHTDKYVQGYFAYDAKKSGGLTVSHLRFSQSPIQSPYYVTRADFISCQNQAFVNMFDLLEGIKPGGKFLLNCIWGREALEKNLPGRLKRAIARNNVEFYTIDAVDIAARIGLGGRINMVMQSAFFKLTNIMTMEEAAKHLKEGVESAYGKQGRAVVDMNCEAIEQGCNAVVHIDYPQAWADAADDAPALPQGMPDFVRDVIFPMNAQQGDKLPVSAFSGREDGTYPTGITKWEKRGVAIEIPRWDAEKCIQCNQCSFVCPHAVVRPLLLDEADMQRVPEGTATAPAIGFEGKRFHLAISGLDCTGCGNCIMVCPAREKALGYVQLAAHRERYLKDWAFAETIEPKPLTSKQISTVKGSQFLKPLNEFSGACAGCGETPYAKLVTQLFGDRMMISNSAGCSTVWGGSPAVSYTKNSAGHGPAWGFSLFEDNAEYGFGMMLGANNVRLGLANKAKETLAGNCQGEVRLALTDWLEHFDEGENARERASRLETAIKGTSDPLLKAMYERRDYLVKRSFWIFGGDGWAYDIGYGGLDHVLAQGEDINVLVFDTEVYSNTGGQSSKATPTAAIAEFAANGKKVRKKDLGVMAMSYGYVYVAQIAMGADRAHTLKVIQEAEAYKGPSLIIAYAPCQSHGIRGGLEQAQMQMKRAVECGYWALYRYDPRRKAKGDNPFTLDSREPTASFRDYLLSEVRYSALYNQFPDTADALFAKAERDAQDRLQVYRDMASRG